MSRLNQSCAFAGLCPYMLMLACRTIRWRKSQGVSQAHGLPRGGGGAKGACRRGAIVVKNTRGRSQLGRPWVEQQVVEGCKACWVSEWLRQRARRLAR